MFDYNELFESLFENGVRYLICGGLAVNIYGIPRMTADIDLILDLEKKNISNFLACIDKLSYHALLPIRLFEFESAEIRQKYKTENNLIAYSFFNNRNDVMSLDVLLDCPLSFDVLWENKETRAIEKFDVFLVSVEHLIDLKSYSNRAQDKSDIILLSKLLRK
jgi:hypothetical protein